MDTAAHGSAEQARGVEGLVAGTVPCSTADGPGRRFVVLLQGCGFDCLVCHAPATIPAHPRRAVPTSVGAVVDAVASAADGLSTVTVSGGEPTAQPDFLAALLTALAADPRTAHLSRLVDTNGDVDAAFWDRVAPVLDGAAVDLKALDTERHVVLTGTDNYGVLASLARLAALGRLAEVRLLLVPGLNDSDADLVRTVRWLAAVAPAVPVRVDGFRHHGTRAVARDLRAVTDADLARYRAVLTGAGARVAG